MAEPKQKGSALDYMLKLKEQKKLEDTRRSYFNQNSLVFAQTKDAYRKQQNILFVPAYIRTHFRNMTEMDIQNLSCRFIATMNIDFYVGKHQGEENKEAAERFAEYLHELFKKELKITFQNDFVVNMDDDLSSNVSDSDRLIRAELVSYESRGTTRFYSNFQITRQFKFGLHSDIFFFPLEQNILDLVTTINAIKTKMQIDVNGTTKSQNLVVRFNCMSLQIESKVLNSNNDDPTIKQPLSKSLLENAQLIDHLKELYMLENKQELDDKKLSEEFFQKRNHPFFRDIKISFPLKKNGTKFGYYDIIERDIVVQYTNQKQMQIEETCYQRLKNCLFCRKKVLNYYQTAQQESKQEARRASSARSSAINKYQSLPSHEQISRQQSFCNVIINIPMLKASLGTIFQLCIPIFFLSFITLVEFLYSASSSSDQIRGYKIGASTLIVATYISFIYAMRSVIPPTPSWSLFQMAVCVLAGSCLFPIIQVIYQTNITDVSSPFSTNWLFIVSFCLNCIICLMIVGILITIKIYHWVKRRRHRSVKVTMSNLIECLTQKYFHLWRNYKCKDFMVKQASYLSEKNYVFKCDRQQAI